MQQRIAPTDANVMNFIYCVKTGSIDDTKSFIQTYSSEIVSRVDMQSRQPPLHFAALISDHDKSYEIMRMLIEAGANPFYKDQFQQTIMFYICRDGKEKCFDLLVEAGVSYDEPDSLGQTPIYYIARENRLNLLAKVIGKVELNRKDKLAHQTPLFYAAKEGHLEMCKLLVQAGCDVHVQDMNNKTAFHYAKMNSRVEVQEYLTSEMYKNKEQRRAQVNAKSQKKSVVPLLESPSPTAEPSSQGKVLTTVTKPKKKEPAVPKKTFYKLVKSDETGSYSDVSHEQLRELYKSYPDLQKILSNPDAIEQAQLDSVKNVTIKQSWQKLAQKALSVCWKAKGGYFFHEPVDPTKYNIPDYFTEIKHPMDFSTIKKNLQNSCYKQPEQFASDVLLVFSNCVAYNGPENHISKCAMQIMQTFESTCKNLGLPLPTKRPTE